MTTNEGRDLYRHGAPKADKDDPTKPDVTHGDVNTGRELFEARRTSTRHNNESE